MSSGKLEKVYDVSGWRAADGSSWYRHLHAIHFAGQHGWAVGSGQILHSQDGGKSWVNQITRQVCQGINTPVRVCAINQHTAWILMLADRARNNCYYTRDAGKEWKEKRLPSLLHPRDIFFLDERFGWIISDDGEVPAGEATIHITIDGGRSWESHQLEIKGAAERLKFSTPKKGLLIQHSTNDDRTRTICNLLASRDGGHSWRVLKAFNRLITDVCAIGEDNLFVVGEGGFISRTTDGGLTWKRSYTRTRDAFNALEVNLYGRGVAAGDFGLLLTSDDAGEHWTNCKTSNELDNIVDLSFVENDRVIVATSRSILSMTLS